jgi:acyl-CoA thioesterase I
MKKIIFILLFSFFIISCTKPIPLEISLTANNATVYIHSQDSFYCNAANGTRTYAFIWNLDKNPINECFNQSVCTQKFDTLGKYEINCEVSDGKEKLNQSVLIEIVKIPKKIDYIIGFGDSLTYGFGVPQDKSWFYLYSDTFEDAKAYDYAINGATSYSVVEYQLSLFKNENISNQKSKLVFLWFGANDIKKLITAEEFKANYINTINEISSMPNTDIILITIPDVSKLQVATDIQQGLNDLISGFGVKLDVKGFGHDVIASYNQVILDLAKEYNLNVIDMFSYMANFDNSLISSDQFHPNGRGHEEINKIVKKDVDGFFKDYNMY